jgi:hypothetical protein
MNTCLELLGGWPKGVGAAKGQQQGSKGKEKQGGKREEHSTESFYSSSWEAVGQGDGACKVCWAEARVKIARMTLTIKLDGNWSSFQLANSAPPLSVTDSAIAPSARISA